MTRRHIHYEAAFEDLLRARRVPYVAVDEAKKALFAEVSLKSFDFLVYPPDGRKLLVDIKGRKVGGKGTASRSWQCWVNREDIEGLSKWREIFGADYRVLLVFSYWLADDVSPKRGIQVHRLRERNYSFLAIELSHYCSHVRSRSSRWDTVSVPARAFRELAVDFTELIPHWRGSFHRPMPRD